MTVNKNNRLIALLAVLLLTSCSWVSSYAQGKNVLHVRFETVKLTKAFVDTVGDIVLNVYYYLVAPKPVNFHGFECRYTYEASKIRPVTTFFDGTACANADFKGANSDLTTGEYRIEVLSSRMLDTANHVLFQVRYSVKRGFLDSAMIAPTRFDALASTSGIDTVIIDNSPGRDQVSWYPFGLVFIDTTTKVPVPKPKASITISSESTGILADSMKTVSINVSSLDSVNIKKAIFEFDIDTVAFDSVAIEKGAILLGSADLSVSHDSTHRTVVFSTSDTSKAFAGGGELLRIVLRGKTRKDTICSSILNPKFTAINEDALLDSVKYQLQGICVFGIAPKDTAKGGVATRENISIVSISPNPAYTYINFISSEGYSGQKHIEAFDALGRKVLNERIDSQFRWELAGVPSGAYTVIITGSIEKEIEKRKIFIIH
jgi:hypothetical protein